MGQREKSVARAFSAALNALSKSVGAATSREWSCSPSSCAAAWLSFHCAQCLADCGSTAQPPGELGNGFLQQLQPFTRLVRGNLVNPVMFPPGRAKLATSPLATGSQPGKDDGNCSGSLLGGRGGRCTRRNNNVYLETDQLSRELREPIDFPSADRHSMTMFFPSK